MSMTHTTHTHTHTHRLTNTLTLVVLIGPVADRCTAGSHQTPKCIDTVNTEMLHTNTHTHTHPHTHAHILIDVQKRSALRVSLNLAAECALLSITGGINSCSTHARALTYTRVRTHTHTHKHTQGDARARVSNIPTIQ